MTARKTDENVALVREVNELRPEVSRDVDVPMQGGVVGLDPGLYSTHVGSCREVQFQLPLRVFHGKFLSTKRDLCI